MVIVFEDGYELIRDSLLKRNLEHELIRKENSKIKLLSAKLKGSKLFKRTSKVIKTKIILQQLAIKFSYVKMFVNPHLFNFCIFSQTVKLFLGQWMVKEIDKEKTIKTICKENEDANIFLDEMPLDIFVPKSGSALKPASESAPDSVPDSVPESVPQSEVNQVYSNEDRNGWQSWPWFFNIWKYVVFLFWLFWSRTRPRITKEPKTSSLLDLAKCLQPGKFLWAACRNQSTPIPEETLGIFKKKNTDFL